MACLCLRRMALFKRHEKWDHKSPPLEIIIIKKNYSHLPTSGAGTVYRRLLSWLTVSSANCDLSSCTGLVLRGTKNEDGERDFFFPSFKENSRWQT